MTFLCVYVCMYVCSVQLCHGHQKEGLGIEYPAWNADSLSTLASSMVYPDNMAKAKAMYDIHT